MLKYRLYIHATKPHVYDLACILRRPKDKRKQTAKAHQASPANGATAACVHALALSHAAEMSACVLSEGMEEGVWGREGGGWRGRSRGHIVSNLCQS